MIPPPLVQSDFVLVHCDQRALDALQALQTLLSPLLVVRAPGGDEHPARYYVVTRLKALQQLQAAPDADVQTALKLAELAPAEPIEPGSPLPPSPKDHVIVGPQGLLGVVIAPDLTSKFSEPVTTAVKRGGQAPVTARRDTFSESEPTDVTRYLEAELPPLVGKGEQFPLLIFLKRKGTTGAPLTQPPGTKINVLVKPLEGLTLLSEAEATLEITEAQVELPVRFKLQAEHPGTARVQIYAFQGAYALASLIVGTTVAEHAVAMRPASAQVTITTGSAPDLSIAIFEGHKELSFRLAASDGTLQLPPFETTRITSSAREHFRDFFRDIENLPLGTASERERAGERLAAKGVNLFETIFPASLKHLLWELRGRIRTVQVVSDEPYIPWEVCKLSGQVNGRIEEGPFFAEEYTITRWLHGVPAAPRLRLRQLALVVPSDSGLAHAPQEKQYMLSLANKNTRVTDIEPSWLAVRQAMATGRFDGWHFIGHARATLEVDADQVKLELANRERLTPEDVSGRVANMALPRPLVFLNACQSAQAGFSLTGVGGWAQRFLKPQMNNTGASAFVGSYWAVDDAQAMHFAKHFYNNLFAGKPIGTACHEARLALRQQTQDPTWLAYTLYADPNAILDQERYA